MIKRIVSLLIIMSMMLHCSSRLGFLSYLYKSRHDIAYTIGLIVEIPIAICSSDYHFNNALVIQHDDADQGSPIGFTNIQEIILFVPTELFSFSGKKILLEKEAFCIYRVTYSSNPYRDIFHPPSIG